MPNCALFDVCGLTDDADPRARCCILHSRNADNAPDAFAAALLAHREKSHTFRAVLFPRFADFAGATFPEAADFSDATFTAGASFSKATFSGETTFTGTTFAGVAYFSETVFAKRVSFIKGTFTEGAHFAGARFTEGANFHSATFTGEADLTQATFVKGATFVHGTFAEKARFAGATFAEKALFHRATFTGVAEFSGATFAKGATFAEATFQDGADFDGVAFQGGKVDFAHCALLGPTRFAPRRIRKDLVPVFGNAAVDFRAVRVEPPDALAFVEANLDRCRLVDTDAAERAPDGVDVGAATVGPVVAGGRPRRGVRRTTAGAVRPLCRWRRLRTSIGS